MYVYCCVFLCLLFFFSSQDNKNTFYLCMHNKIVTFYWIILRDLLFYLFINFTKICRLVFELCVYVCVYVSVSNNGKRLKGNPTLEICLYIVTIYCIHISIASDRIGLSALSTHAQKIHIYAYVSSHFPFSFIVFCFCFCFFHSLGIKSMTVYNYIIIIIWYSGSW